MKTSTDDIYQSMQHTSYKRFKRALIQVSIKILLFLTANSLLFLWLINEPLQHARPWTLFLSTYWNRPADKLYLFWQLFFIVTLAQLVWITYKNLKEFLFDFYYQSNHTLTKAKRDYVVVNIILNFAELCHVIVCAPIKYYKEIYYAAQLSVVTLVAILLWTNFYLATFHYVDFYTLNSVTLLNMMQKGLTQADRLHPFLIALTYALVTITTFVVLSKASPFFYRKLILESD